jgi:hypothetical protein
MSPMDRSKYPTDWEAISRRIRDQADNRCQFCGVENGAIGYRFGPDGKFEEAQGTGDAQVSDGGRAVRIVLTVAHLDHDTANNVDENLRALCQQCHNRHDRPFRTANAARMRVAKRIAAGQLEIAS